MKVLPVFLLVLAGFVAQPALSSSGKLDALFEQLKQAGDQATARQIENEIWQTWFESGDKEIDALMRAAMRERSSYNFEAAVEVLNRVIDQMPEYAEAWNQRATVYFHQSKFEESLQDIATTLELEPRHFGAMAGRAVIRLQQNKPALAMQNVIEASKLHPYLREKSLFPGLE
ncbi:MAG: tetratricopeptide repeat protein [Gammaproteobacteria bacterium]|nr:tetratricopeptide repeat protein [Gammaproteobacteria bacterium]